VVYACRGAYIEAEGEIYNGTALRTQVALIFEAESIYDAKNKTTERLSTYARG
jgi:hypothetical protein